MLLLKHKHPEVCAAFQDGGFVVQPSNTPFSAISMDQAREMNNKVDSGIIGLTENKSALERWLLVCAPEINLHLLQSKKCYGYSSIENEDSSQFHHEQTTSFQKKFIKDLKALTGTINELGNPFKETSQDLISLETKGIPHPEATLNLTIYIEKIGKTQYEEFCNNRLIQQSSSYQSADTVEVAARHNTMTWRNNRTNCRNSVSSNPATSENPKQMSIFASISKNKLELFDFLSVKKTDRAKEQIAILKKNCSLFSRLFIGGQTREGNLEAFFSHENQTFPPSLSQNGTLRPGNKSDLLKGFKKVHPSSSEVPATDAVLDGAAIVNMVQPRGCKTFQDYADNCFILYLQTEVRNAKGLDIVWDIYLPNSLKSDTREKRGGGGGS